MEVTMDKQYIELAKSWGRHFLSGLVSIITYEVTARLSKGIIPPIDANVLVNALWSAGGATLMVVANYLNPNYKNYGKK